jgi:hypothetical protein
MPPGKREEWLAAHQLQISQAEVLLLLVVDTEQEAWLHSALVLLMLAAVAAVVVGGPATLQRAQVVLALGHRGMRVGLGWLVVSRTTEEEEAGQEELVYLAPTRLVALALTPTALFLRMYLLA